MDPAPAFMRGREREGGIIRSPASHVPHPYTLWRYAKPNIREESL